MIRFVFLIVFLGLGVSGWRADSTIGFLFLGPFGKVFIDAQT